MTNAEFSEINLEKIRILNETVWEYRADRQRILRWLDNFDNDDEKAHSLFLLSQFMYFGGLQMRELLKGLYRDLYKYRVIEQIRVSNNDVTDIHFINSEFNKKLKKTRFLGVGNPSESGTHLLYFFRQENKLPKSLFIDSSEIITRNTGKPDHLSNPEIEEYVFFDDFCGTGIQAKKYSNTILTEIKKLNSNIKVSYLMLFCTKKGKKKIINEAKFDYVEAIFELDDSFQCFAENSRYFHSNTPSFVTKNFAKIFCGEIGLKMMNVFWKNEGIIDEKITEKAEKSKLGFGDCQLLIGFNHNTPNNTLPIFWWDEEYPAWYPIFKRYNKVY